jgi:hypothetical protein
MSPQSSRLSRRSFVENSALAAGLLGACHFINWDQAGKGDPCIRAAGGRLVVNGCEFMDEGKRAIILEKGLKAAAIFGCAFRGPQAITDQSGADVQIGLNTSH